MYNFVNLSLNVFGLLLLFFTAVCKIVAHSEMEISARLTMFRFKYGHLLCEENLWECAFDEC